MKNKDCVNPVSIKIKKENIMTVENKEASTIAEVFSSTDEELGIEPVVKEEKIVEVDDTTVVDETQKGEVEKIETGSETVVETDKVESETEVTEKTWTDLGLPQYEGLSRAEVAERVKSTNRNYGEATNTVGELRKKLNTVINDTVKPSESKETKKSIIEAMPNLSASQTEEFNDIYAESPVKAIMQFGGESVIKQMVQEELKTRVPQDLEKIVSARTEQVQYEAFKAQHNLTDDSPEIVWMRTVDTEYLAGQNRSYGDLFKLCQAKKNKEEGFDQIYGLMKKHPTMSFDEAKTFIPKKQVQIVDKTKVEKNVNKLKNANHASQTTKVTDDNMETPGSVQEAFEKHNDS